MAEGRRRILPLADGQEGVSGELNEWFSWAQHHLVFPTSTLHNRSNVAGRHTVDAPSDFILSLRDQFRGNPPDMTRMTLPFVVFYLFCQRTGWRTTSVHTCAQTESQMRPCKSSSAVYSFSVGILMENKARVESVQGRCTCLVLCVSVYVCAYAQAHLCNICSTSPRLLASWEVGHVSRWRQKSFCLSSLWSFAKTTTCHSSSLQWKSSLQSLDESPAKPLTILKLKWVWPWQRDTRWRVHYPRRKKHDKKCQQTY